MSGIDIIIRDFNKKIKVCVSPEDVKVVVRETAKKIDELYTIKK